MGFSDDEGNDESLSSAGTAAVVITSNTPVLANSSPDLEVGTPSVDDDTNRYRFGPEMLSAT